MQQVETLPQMIGNQYTLQELVGVGGMGSVYRGVDMKTGENVAVKLLSSHAVMDDPDLLERFSREAEALRQVNHPNIVKVFGAFEEAGRHYIVMEYVSGGSLSDLLKSQTQLPIKWVLKLAIELADALTRAHYLKIIHRDIKPANVMIAADGTPRLTDFGVAQMGTSERVTRTGSIIGTPDYLPPEALQGESVDNRGDIWAFGVMLFEMLTGQRPFSGNNLSHTITQILTAPMPDLEQLRPDAPIGLVDLVYRMLEKDREARIPSIRLVGAELEALMNEDTTSTITPYSARRAQTTNTNAVTPTTNSAETLRFNTPTPSTNAHKHNLPAQITPFVGRESELKELHRLLNDPQNRLITILGVGGMGKTRLSLQVAEEHLTHYPHGVYFIGLAPLDGAESIVPEIANAVRFTFGTDGRDPKTQLLDFLSEKHLLLVMDNFEHLMDGTALVTEILRAAPNIKILATSRERLNLTGETLFNLEGMDFPEWETPEDALAYSAVKLFLQSAHRVRPDFELTAENLPYVARICRMVHGMPLGILLAAGWVEMLTPQEIADEISKSLDFLESDLRDLPERHRSIRAVFEYSWNLMTDDERQVFMKLTVFHGSFTRQAAQAVANASLRNLTTLVNKSLLRRDPDTGRYSVHTLLRQYADEQFRKCCVDDEIYSKHLAYYADLLAKFEPEFNTRKESAIVDAMIDDMDDVKAAYHYGMEHQRWDELGKMVHSMVLYFIARSMYTMGTKAFSATAEALERVNRTDHPLYWRAKSREAWLVSRVGEYDRTWQLADSAYHYFSAHRQLVEAAYALNSMCYARMGQGDYESAKEFARLAARYGQQGGAADAEITAYANHGYVEYLSGNLDEARRIYEHINQITEDKDYSPTGRAYVVNNLGEVMQAMGKFETAQKLFTEAYNIFKTANQRRGMAFTSNNLAGVCEIQGHFDQAKAMYQEAHRLNKEIADRWGIGHSLAALGNVAFYTGDLTEAERMYNESLSIRRAIGDRRGIADSLNDLGDIAIAAEDYPRAEQLYHESLAIRRQIGDPIGIVQSTVWLGLAQALGNTRSSEDIRAMYLEAEATAMQSQNPFGLAVVTIGLAELALDVGDYVESHHQFLRSAQIGYENRMLWGALMSIGGLAAVLDAEGDKVGALELVALIRRYPRTFVSFLMDDRIKGLYESLTQLLPAETVKTIEERAEDMDVYEVIRAYLAKASG